MVRMSNEAITKKEVSESVKQMEASKAAVPDGVHPMVERQLAETPVKPLTWLFYASLDEIQLPTDWLP